MTAKSALCKALLDGRVLNVKNVFTTIGLTNCAREVSRMIEKPFSVTVSRTPMQGKSRYGQPVTWTDYRLNSSQHNLEGIEKMKEYVAANGGEVLMKKETREVERPVKYKQVKVPPQNFIINTQNLFG